MRTLVVYYSRTGHTRQVAEALVKALQCDSEEILDTVNRSGPLGWMTSGRQASSKALTRLHPIKHDPSQYDLVVVGTPIWARTMSAPVRTYLTENKDKIKSLAFFCNEGSTGAELAFAEMEALCGIKPKATLATTVADLKSGGYAEMVKKFAGDLK